MIYTFRYLGVCQLPQLCNLAARFSVVPMRRYVHRYISTLRNPKASPPACAFQVLRSSQHTRVRSGIPQSTDPAYCHSRLDRSCGPKAPSKIPLMRIRGPSVVGRDFNYREARVQHVDYDVSSSRSRLDNLWNSRTITTS